MVLFVSSREGYEQLHRFVKMHRKNLAENVKTSNSSYLKGWGRSSGNLLWTPEMTVGDFISQETQLYSPSSCRVHPASMSVYTAALSADAQS